MRAGTTTRKRAGAAQKAGEDRETTGERTEDARGCSKKVTERTG